ncbi:hypothetical protein ACFSJ3_03805 [Corallincola platygyrae]|uniref:Uncharacterized protein n=1 Tax=Corallincola platygyrae TaxID=1193278 RepID=A0ABW4XK86_9GAMM
MTLKQDPRCYTNVCVGGLWYHYDHCSTRAYVLRGGATPEVTLEREPRTEEELVNMLQSMTPPV